MIERTIAIFALALVAPWAAAQSAVDGEWDFAMSSPFGQVSAKVTMVTEGNKLTGAFDLGNDRFLEIQEGSVDGNSLSFTITREGMMTMTYLMSAVAEGDTMSGTATAMGTTAPWSMTRSK